MGLLDDAYQSVAGVADHAAGSVDESIGRQFDDAPGGGFAEWSNQDRDRFDRDTNGVETFGDGSNRWIDGMIETLQGDGKADISGVLDAAALNFDEGVGGIVSLVDAEPGNTAGPGQSPWIESPRDGQPSNPGTTGVPLLDQIWKLLFIGAGLWLLVNLVVPVLEIGAAVLGE